MKIVCTILVFCLIIGFARSAINENYQHDLKLQTVVMKLANFSNLTGVLKTLLTTMRQNSIDRVNAMGSSTTPEMAITNLVALILNGLLSFTAVLAAPLTILIILLDTVGELIGMWETGNWVPGPA